MKKLLKIALSLIGALPIKTIKAQDFNNVNKDRLKTAKNINLYDLQLSEFHNLVLPDRSKGIKIEDALNNFNRHFPNDSYEERELVFQKYLDHLIATKKIAIDSTYTLRGNESGLTKEK